VDDPAHTSFATPLDRLDRFNPLSSEGAQLASPFIADAPVHGPVFETATKCVADDAALEKTEISTDSPTDSERSDPETSGIAEELPIAELPPAAHETREAASADTNNAPAEADAIEAAAILLESPLIESHADDGSAESAGMAESELELEAPVPAPRRAVCTVLHCELTNHAVLVNSMHPAEFTTLLNQVINAFEEMVGSRGGVCDRLSGDSLRAFFETPPADPEKGKNAMHCALALKNRFGAISQACELKSGIDLDLRIGVNTGEMVIARFGSGDRHFDGVAGESAEWGGRLASANLLYGSRILIGASSHLLAGDAFEARPIDLLQREMPPEPPEAVFELLAAKGALSMDARERLNLYCEGVMLFRERRWKEAATALRAARPKRSNDDAIDLLLHRISEQETLAEFTV
jgi:class 3 adenylate cyclase